MKSDELGFTPLGRTVNGWAMSPFWEARRKTCKVGWTEARCDCAKCNAWQSKLDTEAWVKPSLERMFGTKETL